MDVQWPRYGHAIGYRQDVLYRIVKEDAVDYEVSIATKSLNRTHIDGSP